MFRVKTLMRGSLGEVSVRRGGNTLTRKQARDIERVYALKPRRLQWIFLSLMNR